MKLWPGEPAAGPWRVERLDSFLLRLLPTSVPTRPQLLAVDGRSSSGKPTFAARVTEHWTSAEIVHTDDIAWAHSRFGWTDLLADGVLGPLRRGEAVSYRPPAWQQHNRTGFIQIPRDVRLVVVEGVGSGRAELASLYDAIIWVQADAEETARRDHARIDTPNGPPVHAGAPGLDRRGGPVPCGPSSLGTRGRCRLRHARETP